MSKILTTAARKIIDTNVTLRLSTAACEKTDTRLTQYLIKVISESELTWGGTKCGILMHTLFHTF